MATRCGHCAEIWLDAQELKRFQQRGTGFRLPKIVVEFGYCPECRERLKGGEIPELAAAAQPAEAA